MAKGILSGELAPLILAGGVIYLGYKSDIFGKIGQGIQEIGAGLGSGVSKIGDIGTGLGSGLSQIGGGVYNVGAGVEYLGAGLGSGFSAIGGGAGNLLSGTAPANIIEALKRSYENPYSGIDYSKLAEEIAKANAESNAGKIDIDKNKLKTDNKKVSPKTNNPNTFRNCSYSCVCVCFKRNHDLIVYSENLATLDRNLFFWCCNCA